MSWTDQTDHMVRHIQKDIHDTTVNVRNSRIQFRCSTVVES